MLLFSSAAIRPEESHAQEKIGLIAIGGVRVHNQKLASTA